MSTVTGHLEKRAKGGWNIVLELGRDPKTGKRRRKKVVCDGTKPVATKEMAKLIIQYDNNGYIDPSNMTFGDYLFKWLNKYARKKEAKTYASYESIITLHIIPRLGNIMLDRLRHYHIQDYIDEIQISGRLDGKEGGLAATSVIKHYRIIHRALHYAVTKEMIPRNYAKGVELPSKKKPKYKILSIEEISKMISHDVLEGERIDFCRIADLAVNTGLRRGEVLGLRKLDIDLNNKTIEINQTIQYTKEKGVFIKPTPKNEASQDVIFISDHEAELLKAQIVDQKKRKLILGEDYKDHGLIFSQDDGMPLHPDTISSWFPNFMERHNLPRIRFHDLRHTHISILIDSGASLAAVSERARHAEKSTTANIYTHALDSAKKEIAEIMSKRLATTQ